MRGTEIDLTCLPAPTFWPADGGPFIGTGGITITANPTSGRLNAGCYRQQLYSPTRIGLNFVPGRHGQVDCEAAWAQGKPCEIVAAFGIDPALFMVGGMRFGPNESELDAAGGIMGRPVELTEAEYVSLPIPARAEIVIEGLAHAGDLETEGPLGEFHGYYSGAPGAQTGHRGEGAAHAAIAHYHRGADGGLSVMRDRRISVDHARGPHP